MAVPARKMSKTSKRTRRASNYTLSANNTTKCPKCGASIRPHRVCPKCGTYKNKEVIKTEK